VQSPSPSAGLADPSTLDMKGVLAQETSVLAAERTSHSIKSYRVPSGALPIVEGTSYAGAEQVDVHGFDASTRKPTDTLLLRVPGHLYTQIASRCWVDIAGRIDQIAQPAQLQTWFATTLDVLKSLHPVSYHAFALTLDATMPLREAVLFFDLGDVADFGTIRLDELTGSVPVSVKFEAEGPLQEIDIPAPAVARLTKGNADIPPSWTKLVSTLGFAEVAERDSTEPLTVPPADELAPGPGQGCAAAAS
jgi:hypothetical protein